jgi:hypothetical protein
MSHSLYQKAAVIAAFALSLPLLAACEEQTAGTEQAVPTEQQGAVPVEPVPAAPPPAEPVPPPSD